MKRIMYLIDNSIRFWIIIASFQVILLIGNILLTPATGWEWVRIAAISLLSLALVLDACVIIHLATSAGENQ